MVKQNKKRFLYPDEYKKLIQVMKPNQKYIAKVLINTGARYNEAKNILKQDLDNNRSTIVLRKTKVRAKLGEKIPQPRIISVSNMFFKYMKKNVGKYKFITNQAFNISLHKLTPTIKIKNPDEITAHNFRKTFGTWMLALGCDGFKIAQHLGHTPTELARDYATNDVFNDKDKEEMKDILGNLHLRFIQRPY